MLKLLVKNYGVYTLSKILCKPNNWVATEDENIVFEIVVTTKQPTSVNLNSL